MQRVLISPPPYVGYNLPARRAGWLLAALVALAALLATASACSASGIAFDAPQTIELHDVTGDEFAKINPDERLLEARIQVSAFFPPDADDQPVEFLYRFETPHRLLRVADYQPRTTLASEVKGEINVDKSDDQTQSAGLTITGAYDHHVKAGADASKGWKSHVGYKYELLPPLELVAASGTVQRGRGAYFKLKPSRRVSLEGAKEFVIVFRAPACWRGDLLHLHCRAVGKKRSVAPPFEETVLRGASSFVVAAHLAGDDEAKQAAWRLADAETSLRSIASHQRKAIEKAGLPTVFHELGAAMSLVDSKVPDDWLPRLMFLPADVRGVGVIGRLPAPVGKAASTYLGCKTALYKLSVSPPPVAAAAAKSTAASH